MKHQQEEGPLEGQDRVALLPEQLFLVLSLVQMREEWHLGYLEEVKNHHLELQEQEEMDLTPEKKHQQEQGPLQGPDRGEELFLVLSLLILREVC